MLPPARVIERLRAIARESEAIGYPDTDNQLEDGVFSFAKRDDEARVWRELIADLPAPRTGVALDAGCGLGAHAERLAETFEGAVLLDADPARAHAAARRTGLPLDEQVFCARLDDDALLHPDLAGAFSFVQMIQVLGHVPIRSVARVLAALHHVLAPGGALLLAVPFFGGGEDLFFATRKDAASGRVAPTEIDKRRYDELARAPQPGVLQVRHFCMTSLLGALAMAGFVDVKTRPYHWFSHDTGDVFALARRGPR